MDISHFENPASTERRRNLLWNHRQFQPQARYAFPRIRAFLGFHLVTGSSLHRLCTANGGAPPEKCQNVAEYSEITVLY